MAAEREQPLSFAQETMLFWDRLVPRSAVYNVPVAIALRGHLDREALRASIDLIVSRHQVLRSNFVFVEGEPAIRVNPSGGTSLSFVDLSHLAPADREQASVNLANSEARRPFHLAKDPMLRAVLFCLSETQHVLVITLHHIAADGWSIGVLFDELAKAYPAFASGNSPQLPPLTIQYRDFAKWQREQLQGAALERSLTFWKQQLAGISDYSDLPRVDHPRVAHQTFEGATLRTVIPDHTLSAIGELGQQRRATPFMVMLAAFQALLQRNSEKTEVVLGVPVANRNRPEFTKLIGCFINMVVVRGDLSGDPTFLELLGRVRETSLAAFLHPELPLSELVRHLRPKRSSSHTPWFQVQMVFQNYPMPEIQWPGLSVRRFEVDTATSKFDLSVLIEKKEGLEIAFEYNTSLFEQATMKRMLDDYTLLLEQVVRHPDSRLRSLASHALVSHA